MENKLSFVFMHSLKEIALKRMAINLWNQRDVLVSIENFCKVSPKSCQYSEKWRETVENKVKQNVAILPIPVALKKELILLVTPISLEILRWKVFHERYLQELGSKDRYCLLSVFENLQPSHAVLGVHDLQKLHWTSSGRIDYGLTAEELIRGRMLDCEKRYALACFYCLEIFIPHLWEELPEEVKRKYYEEKISGNKGSDLPYWWPHILSGDQPKLERLIQGKVGHSRFFNQFALYHSARAGNEFATAFFWRKLSNEEITVSSFTKDILFILSRNNMPRNCLDTQLPPEHFGSVLRFLLALMNYEQKKEIIKWFPISLLNCFLDWPWHDIFFKIPDLIWGFLSTAQFDQLLERILNCFIYSSYCYPKFFQELFTRSPIEFRKRFVDYECRFGKFFSIFFRIQDSEAIEIVFRNTDAADRVRLMSSEPIHKLFYNYLFKGRGHMVEVCLQVAMRSNVDKEILREAFMRVLTRFDGKKIKSKPVWMRFLQILDETSESSKRKRSSDDETRNEAKKLCSETSESSKRKMSSDDETRNEAKKQWSKE